MPNIILAEDQAKTARIMKIALEKHGFDVTWAKDGKAAFDAVMAAQPEALITDIEMPVMDGQALCQALEDALPDRTFPIYVVTSVTDLVHRKWTKDIADLYFIEKPVSINRLTSELNKRFSGSA